MNKVSEAAGADSRLTLRRDPVRLAFSGGLWRAAGYLAGYVFGTGWLLFTAAFASVLAAVLLAVTIVGAPLFTAAAAVLRGCANVERARLRLAFSEPVRGGYRPAGGPGVLARARSRWRDVATWRDFAYLFGLWPWLFALDLAVLTVWLVFVAGITTPAWYWAIPNTSPIGYNNGASSVKGLAFGSFPHGPNGPGAEGFFVDTLPKALLLAAACLILFLLFNYALVATARAHASVARGLLRPPADPLAAARAVLAGPGPLPPLQPAAGSRAADPPTVCPPGGAGQEAS